jgi:hypothetical protein
MIYADVNLNRQRLAQSAASQWQFSTADAWVYALTFIPGLVVLAGVALQTRAPIIYLLKDPFTVVQLSNQCCHVYYGLVSNLGVMLWTTAAAVCLFTALLLVNLGRRGAEPIFLIAAGLFTGWLALDDFFMIHEDVLPLFGVPQPLTYAGYAGAAALYLLLSWRQILDSRPALMALAMALLGTSVVIDVLVHSESTLHVFMEDGAKFLGILAWTGFHVTAALDIATAAVMQPRVVLTSRPAR